MNAQASWLWFEQLGKALHAKLGLPFSVEVRPIHLQIPLADGSDAYFAIGDANGPIGFDLATSKGEVFGTAADTTNYVGDPVEPLAIELAGKMLACLWENAEDLGEQIGEQLQIDVCGERVLVRCRFCGCRGIVPWEAGKCTNVQCSEGETLPQGYGSRLYCAACNEPIMGEARRDKAGFPYHNALGCFKPMLGGD